MTSPLMFKKIVFFFDTYCAPILARTFSMGKGLEKEPLNPMWKGLYSVILTTPTALKVAGIDTWIHYSRVKSASLN